MKIFKWKLDWIQHDPLSWSRRIDRRRLFEPNYVHVFYAQTKGYYIVVWQGKKLQEYKALYENLYSSRSDTLLPLVNNVNNFINKLQKIHSFS